MFFILCQNQFIEMMNGFHCRHSVSSDELNGLARAIAHARRPAGKRQKPFGGNPCLELVSGIRPIHSQNKNSFLFDSILFFESRFDIVHILDGNRDLVVPDRRVGSAGAIRFDRDFDAQDTVRKQPCNVEVSLTIFVVKVTQFSSSAENGAEDLGIAGRTKQLDALQNRGLAAVVPPDEEVDAPQSVQPERTEATVTVDPYRRVHAAPSAASIKTDASRLSGSLADTVPEVGFVGARERHRHQRIDGASGKEIEVGREGRGDFDASGAE